MTDYKTTLKSNIRSLELDKKKVKITCQNNNAGKTVLTTLSQNSSLFGGAKFDINQGLTVKDFTIKFKDKDEASAFKNTLQKILDDKTVVTTEPEKTAAQKAAEKAKTAINNAVNTATAVLTGQPVATKTTVTPSTTTATKKTVTPSTTTATKTTATPSTTTATPSAATAVADEMPSESNNKTLLIAGVASVVVLLLVLVLWKAKK